MDSVAASMGDQVSFYRVDTDKSPELTERFGIQSIPTLLRFEAGKQVAQAIGFQPEAGVRRFASGG